MNVNNWDGLVFKRIDLFFPLLLPLEWELRADGKKKKELEQAKEKSEVRHAYNFQFLLQLLEV